MKVFFDTNVYVAEALLGRAAERMLAATRKGSWHIYISEYVGQELERVLTEALDFSRRFAVLSRKRALRRATLVKPGTSRHVVPVESAAERGHRLLLGKVPKRSRRATGRPAAWYRRAGHGKKLRRQVQDSGARWCLY